LLRLCDRLKTALGEREETILATEVRLEEEKERLTLELAKKDAQLGLIASSLGWRLLSHYGPFKYRYLLPIYRLLRLFPPKPKVSEEE